MFNTDLQGNRRPEIYRHALVRESSPDSLPEVSVILPCLNEAETLAICIDKAQGAMKLAGVSGEVIVADNGSTDNSHAIALALGARLVKIAERGYGNALLGGIRAARGKYIVMADADDSYDLNRLMDFVEELRRGYDLVMGNRFKGGIKSGAMPFLHKYLGNPVLTGVGRWFFASPCGDFHCGMRGFRKDAIATLDLQAGGMEFASEMVVKATVNRLRISEIATTLSPDGRTRPPHLRSWRDGWRHLRFMLMFSPRWLFFYPGMALMTFGTIVAALLWRGPQTIGPLTFDIHSLLYASVLALVGFQAVTFAICSRTFAVGQGFLPKSPALEKGLRLFNLEIGIVAGALLACFGVGLSLYAMGQWSSQAFGALDPKIVMRSVIPGAILFSIGCQIVLTSFLLGILSIGRRTGGL